MSILVGCLPRTAEEEGMTCGDAAKDPVEVFGQCHR
jgi:hypothetical protein